ncbi:Uncharacterised protein [Klebsiella oxytoca]|nr:Uncharacterised protein [Klebsiella oxytoca]
MLSRDDELVWEQGVTLHFVVDKWDQLRSCFYIDLRLNGDLSAFIRRFGERQGNLTNVVIQRASNSDLFACFVIECVKQSTGAVINNRLNTVNVDVCATFANRDILTFDIFHLEGCSFAGAVGACNQHIAAAQLAVHANGLHVQNITNSIGAKRRTRYVKDFIDFGLVTRNRNECTRISGSCPQLNRQDHRQE